MEQAFPSAEPLDPGAPPAAPQPLVSPESLAPEPADASSRSPALATLGPWYHTLGIVFLLLVYAFVAHLTHGAAGGSAAGSRLEQHVSEAARAIAEAPKVPLYCSTVMLSWMLLASVVAGLYHRRAFFRSMLRNRFASRWTDAAIGLGIYLSFLSAVSIFIFLLTAALMVRTHGAHTETASHTPTQQSPASSSPPPSAHGDAPKSTAQPAPDVQAVQQRVQRMLHFNRQAVASIAPRTLPELLLWIGLSFTAGFCEEHIFRGYLLSQAMAVLRRLAMPSWLAAVASVLATSLLFGSLHLYEGVGGAVMVGLLGALFATMTLVLGNLRAVIVAHFLQDFLGGLVYYIAHLRHAL